jgi:hypothetical protein
MDNKGFIAAEYILLVGILPVIIVAMATLAADNNELNIAMGAASSGALQGIMMDSAAVYSSDAFYDYQRYNPRLLLPSEIKILKIEYKNQGYNSSYQKIKIQLRVYVAGPSIKDYDDRNSLGDRINYNMRKSISEVFNTQNLSNTYYNPAFSNKFVFTTGEVVWI